MITAFGEVQETLISLSAHPLDWKLQSVHSLVWYSMHAKVPVVWFLKAYFPCYYCPLFWEAPAWGSKICPTWRIDFSFPVYFLSSSLLHSIFHRMGKLFWIFLVSSQSSKTSLAIQLEEAPSHEQHTTAAPMAQPAKHLLQHAIKSTMSWAQV